MRRTRSDSMDLEQVQSSLRSVARPLARQEFRDRLRGQFVREATPSNDRDGTRAPQWGPLRLAATATGLVGLILAGWHLNTGPAWKLIAATGTGTMQVDGRPIALDSMATLGSALKPGAHVRLPEGAQLDFELPAMAVVQITGGTEATLPGRPGRWWGRSMRAALEAGEMRISTGSAFAGVRFSIVTPEVRAIVTGTTLAVFRLPDASCVCVFEGRVAMLGGAADDTVRAGFRRSVFRDGRAPLMEPIRPMETMKLTMLRDQATQALER